MKKNIQHIALFVLISGLFATSCQERTTQELAVSTDPVNQISREEVIAKQKSWGDAIVLIGNAYSNGEDYQTIVVNALDSLYGYNQGTVLFKPTKAAEHPFRLTKEEALSYFMTGMEKEDHGFALNPWSNVRFENAGIILNGNTATAMGHYYFTDANTGNEVMVEYTFGYFKDADGNLRINVHHSSVPYQPVH